MRLSDLFLNRFLYRNNDQNSETKDAAFVAGDSSESEPAGIPSGGAAQDINTGGVEIDGAVIEAGTIPETTLNVSNYGWGQTCVFSSTDADTVSWGAGTFTSASGDAYSISAGNTGNMTAKTFIYLDLDVSETEYQTTTTSADAVGLGKVLIAVAEDASDDATFAMQEATQITGDNIIANTIDASKITTGQLVVGTNVGLGTAQDSSGVTTIIGNTVTTSYLNAKAITVLGAVTAGSLTGLTVTGGTIRTDDSGARVQMTGATNYLSIYDSSRERMRLSQEDMYFYNPSGTNIGKLWSDNSNMWLERPDTGGYFVIKTGSTSTYGILFQNGTTSVALVNSRGIITQNNLPIYPSGAHRGSIGTSVSPYQYIYADTHYFTKSGATTKYLQLNASSGIDCNANFYVGGALSKAAGSFKIDHPLKPDTHYLQHSFVESPDMLNLYRGNGYILDGLCEVSMPDWFTPLNGTKTDDYSYQVTSIGKKNNIWVMEEMTDGKVLFAGDEDGKFSYLITAIRHDKYAEENRIEVELEKK